MLHQAAGSTPKLGQISQGTSNQTLFLPKPLISFLFMAGMASLTERDQPAERAEVRYPKLQVAERPEVDIGKTLAQRTSRERCSDLEVCHVGMFNTALT